MRSFGFWQKWILFASILLILGGFALAFFNQTYLFKIFFTNRINAAFWNSPDVAQQVVMLEKWLFGVLGALIAGWGIFMFYVARGPFKNKERWAWNCFVISLGLWFLIDAGISIYFGVYINVIIDVLWLLIFAVPLFYTRKDFYL